MNSDGKEVECKIVLHGPEGAGKRTVLSLIENAVDNGLAREWMPRAGVAESGQVFGFLPLRTRKTSELNVRFNIFTLPRRSEHEQTGKHLVRNMDGAVFVFDSRWGRMGHNLRCLRKFYQNYALSESLPIVYLYNRIDLKETAPKRYMDFVLNNGDHRRPSFGTNALGGRGVFDGLNAIAKLVVSQLDVDGDFPREDNCTVV